MLKFPELRQDFDYDCGPKALQAVFSYYGIEVKAKQIRKKAKTTKQNGTLVEGMVKTIRGYGLKCISKPMEPKMVKAFIQRKIPVILLLQAWTKKKKVDWSKNWSDGHYVIAIGYDNQKLYFEDPWTTKRTFLTIAELKTRWHDIDINGKKYINQGIAVYGRKPVYDANKAIHMD